ncbi:sugar ABC transporter substrate-binding protein [Fodinicurvata sp. EGI_FJ10296]|uniref:ABC transporter substrate-binding protein n=1 Tax=Fodinicurvata sp. EGI_FJ10296 TaxID=3231908 RepID=UPI003454C0F6
MRRTFRTAVSTLAISGGLVAMATTAQAQDWDLATAAEPYSGTTINAIFLDRPGYRAAIELIPEFEEATGINVEWEILPYENSRERQVLDFTAGGDIDVVLVDVVWIGEFAANGWVEPMDQFFDDESLADPDLNLDGFFPILLESFGTWDETIYGLPFDNYSGLLYYNSCMLEDAGFDGPPETWTELYEDYGPALTEGDQYAFALQSRRGETQSADSFMRVLWPFGGALLDDEFRSALMTEESQTGLQFRQDLMEYMPPGIVDYDHAEAVNALAQGQVAMITEWSSFYSTLADPASSDIVDCLEVATEPAGPAGLKPALGGFSLAVASQSSDAEKAASYLFIQWITSEEMAVPYLEAGGVAGRTAPYEDQDILDRFPYAEPMVQSWQGGVPDFRPRFPEWPEISEIIADWGTRIMLGDVSTEEGAREIGDRMEAVLDRAGYYDGDKPLMK